MSDERGRRPRTDEQTVGELVEVVVRKLVTAIVIAGGLIALGLYSQDVEAPDYQIAASADGRVYRVNTESGSIVGCEKQCCAILLQRGIGRSGRQTARAARGDRAAGAARPPRPGAGRRQRGRTRGAGRALMEEAVSATQGLGARLLSLRVAKMLGRNTIVSCAVFAVDILLLWGFVEWLAVGKIPAAIVAFVIANSIHYAFCRSWIFRGTERAWASGYFYFLSNATLGLGVTIILFWAFMAIGLHYLAARVVASVFAGLAVFLLNAILNFRSV